jgi:hypothetical protein
MFYGNYGNIQGGATKAPQKRRRDVKRQDTGYAQARCEVYGNPPFCNEGGCHQKHEDKESGCAGHAG